MKDTLLPFLKDEKPPPKNLFTHGILPGYTEPEQLPTKKKPFSTVWGLRWHHTVDILIHAELYEAVQKQLEAWQVEQLRYANVIMSLRDIVEGDFFNEYVKKGNIRMLSEGRRGVDESFELYEGVLRLELDKSTYERVGLVGKPIPDGGRKHIKSRFSIELDLRHPSMIRGKKLFDRMVFAFKNVLNQSLTWLFYDCREVKGEEQMCIDIPAPIEKHHPLWKSCQPLKSVTSSAKNLNLPIMTKGGEEEMNVTPAFSDEEYTGALEEQIALIVSDSPRVHANDTIDPYLCRYEPPSLPHAVADDTETETIQQGRRKAQKNEVSGKVDLVRLRYHGFLQAEFVVKLLAAVKHAAKKEQGHNESESEVMGSQKAKSNLFRQTWFAMLAHGFADEHATILGLTNNLSEQMHYLEWFHQQRL